MSRIALTTYAAIGCEACLLPYDADMRNDDPNQIARRPLQWLQPAREEILVFLVSGGAAIAYMVLAFGVNLTF
jgi:hypothetical protein